MKTGLAVDEVNRLIQQSLPEEQRELVSDGYHNFKELYAHRVALFVALCSVLSREKDSIDSSPCDRRVITYNDYPWKSLKHADGTMYDGWFIAGIGTEKGKTLTYHLPIEEWHNMYAIERVNAPEWDGHTSQDVINLLKNV